MALRISLSAIRSFQRCEQQYAYRYIKRLRRRDGSAPMALGILIHDYLEHYYRGLKSGKPAVEAHVDAQMIMTDKNHDRLNTMKQAALNNGDEDTAIMYAEMPDKAQRITDMYFESRGLQDANRYEILYVEEWYEHNVTPRLLSVGKIDLVTRDRVDGTVDLWEHKSTKDVPPTSLRLFDLQTTLYDKVLRELNLAEPDRVTWNYIRTKEPTVPELVYKGKANEGISRAKGIDTTWKVYLDAILAHGKNPDDYEDMRDLLADKEHSTFFPRYEHYILSDLPMRDYITTGENLIRTRKRWRAGLAKPVRAYARDCDWCEFKDLCKAAMVGADEADVIRQRFYVSKPQPKIEVVMDDEIEVN